MLCSSHYDAATGEELHTVDAIAEAVDHIEPGDVLLLEVQRPGEGGTRPLPTEIDPADFDAISDATGAGIVVVEAAGNGTRDLDLWRHPTDGPLRAMRRDGPGDSQAIIVGSCVAQRFQDGHARFPDSNWGERVDCYAWGESVPPRLHGVPGVDQASASRRWCRRSRPRCRQARPARPARPARA